MSNVWKRPPLSQPVTLAACLAQDDQEDKGATSRCAECRGELFAVLESTLLAAARLRAAAIEREAQRRAEALLAAARREAEDLRAQAEAAGREEGYRAGYAAGQQAAAQLLEEARAEREEARKEHAALLAAVEPEALELALALARRILHREVRVGPADARELLAAAAAKLPTGEAVTVEIAVGERAAWEAERELVEQALGDRPYTLAESANVPPGEFLLRSEMGTVDARLDSQLEACRAQLTGVGSSELRQAQPGPLP